MSIILDKLFSNMKLSAKLEEVRNNAIKEADNIHEDIALNNKEEYIIDNVYAKNYIFPLQLDLYNLKQTSSVVNRDIIKIKNYIPCAGSEFLWRSQPNKYTEGGVNGFIHEYDSTNNNGVLLFEVQISPSENTDNKTIIEERVNKHIALIEMHIESINNMVNEHNRQMKEYISNAFLKRKKQLTLIKDTLKCLNIPLEKNPNAPDFTKIPIIKITPPKLLSQTRTQEHIISDEVYAYILKVVRLEGRTHEQLSRTIAKLEEEEIRDFYLAHLNGHFNGKATGETFRKAGKTDIRIEFDNRSAFIGECKIWHGEKQLHDAIDQLASYTTWRDCKCALIIYNKDNKGFTALEKEMSNRLNTFNDVVGKAETLEPGEWRIRIKSKEDENRHIIIHVFLFNLYNPE